MEITEVKVYPVKDEGKLKAYATMVFDNEFIVRDMKIIQSVDGSLFVSMPSRKKRDGTFKDVAHPLKQDTRLKIERRIIEEYEKGDQNPVSADEL
jgi:stage V sporulation protein G